MKFKQYRFKNRKKIFYKIFVIIMVLLIIIVLIDAKTRPLIRTIAASQAKDLATVAINDSVNEILKEEAITYDDLVMIEYNKNGCVTSVKTDIIKINRLKAVISKRISEKISQIQNKQIKIPLGSLLGSEVLAGRGPHIKIYINLSGNAETQIRNEFKSEGINQTIHRMMLDINANVYVVLFKDNISTQVKTSMCIAETVIVGVVPDTYADINGLKDFPQK